MDDDAQALYARYTRHMLDSTGTLVDPWDTLDSGTRLAWQLLADDIELFPSEQSDLDPAA